MLCRAGETASSLTIKNEMSSLTLNLLSNLLKAKAQKSNTSVNMHHAVSKSEKTLKNLKKLET